MRARLALLLMAAIAAPALADGQLEDPDVARRAGPPPAKVGEGMARFGHLGHLGPRAATGALAGKTIYVSAGHGWVWDASLGRWRTQRGNTHDLVEDFVSVETLSQHLVPLLHDMGAYVVPVREIDLSSEMVLVDDADAEVTGATAATDGFATPAGPVTGDANPFAGGGSQLAAATAEPTSAARWVIAPAADLEAYVYLAWVQAADRAPDAHYVIHHAGGDSDVRVDQRRHGSTWVLVGHFRFLAADPPERRSVELRTDSATPGAMLSIDAVRVGGGPSHIDRGMGTSARPAFEDGARYAAQWNGAPSTVWDYTAEDGNDDVGTRSRFSAWDHEPGEDAVYVAWHTNAPSPARGTSSFAYGPSAFGPLSEFSGVPGSLELMDAIHDELIADLRASWEPAWQDRQQHTAYFGEVNPNHNSEMPATLIEVAFHDTLADANALREPAFRHLAARAIAQGIAKYFAARDGATLVLPPGQPTAPRARWNGAELVIAWSPPVDDPAGGDAPAGYRVHLSPDGRAFDDGRDVTGGAASLTLPAGALGRNRFVRITAYNAGGRSRPSSVVGAEGLDPGVPDVLVVAGFTRLDGAQLFHEDLSARALGTVDRAYEVRINDGSHGARIGQALERAGYGHAIASVDAVRAGAVALADYRAVVWLTGEEIAPLTAADRTMLAAYLDGGGALVLSGAEAAAGLATDDAAFLESLGATFAADDADTYALAGAAALAGETFTFDDTTPGGYDADAADVLAATAASTPLLTYTGGTTAALVQTAPRRAAVLGFPLETVPTVDARARILGAALAALDVEPEPVPCACPGGCCDAGGADPRATIALILVVAALLLTRAPRLTTMRPHGLCRRCSR
ncbi:MAG TPA: N-acetylmuramoyl-L-alanine amidase [Kofleriaceae bacterium]|nr:N-acetylmuramoyl-L-alanine amidase [Kofleriaceae bacterium]